MRVMLLVDDLSQRGQLAADLDLLTHRLDTQRIQLAICAVRAPADGLVDTSLNARSRFSLSAARRLAAMLRELDIELLHILEPGALFCGAVAARLAGVPGLMNATHLSLTRPVNWLSKQREHLAWRLAFWGANSLIVSSELVKRDLTYLFRKPSNRVAVVYPGIEITNAEPDRAAFELPDGPLLVLILPDEPDSGYDMVPDVLHRLMRRQPEAQLVVIGGGPVAASIRQKAQSFRPALPIRWMGNLSPDDTQRVIAAADVVIDCASREGLHSGPVLAALVGKPVVATRLESIIEVVEPNVSGLLVMQGDVADMTLQIQRLLQYEGLSHRLGRMAQRRGLERFSMDAQRSAMIELYEATIYATR